MQKKRIYLIWEAKWNRARVRKWYPNGVARDVWGFVISWKSPIYVSLTHTHMHTVCVCVFVRVCVTYEWVMSHTNDSCLWDALKKIHSRCVKKTIYINRTALHVNRARFHIDRWAFTLLGCVGALLVCCSALLVCDRALSTWEGSFDRYSGCFDVDVGYIDVKYRPAYLFEFGHLVAHNSMHDFPLQFLLEIFLPRTRHVTQVTESYHMCVIKHMQQACPINERCVSPQFSAPILLHDKSMYSEEEEDESKIIVWASCRWMSRVARGKESCHTHEGATSHTWMIHEARVLMNQ